MLTTNQKGKIAEWKAVARAIELGFVVNIPQIDCRYDLVLDDGHSLTRVQVKSTTRIVSHCSGSVSVNLCYETRQRRHIYTYSANEVDALVVYIPSIEKLCWFDIDDFIGKTALSIRLDPPLNGQRKGVIFAQDHFW